MIVIFAAECVGFFVIAVNFFSISLAKDIQCDLYVINKNVKTKKSRAKIMKQISAFVEFHSKVMQLC